MLQLSRSTTRTGVRRLVALATLWALAPADTAQADTAQADAPQADAPQADTESPETIVYRRGEVVTPHELVDLGAPADLGGEVLDGDPQISARIDFGDGTLTAGVFQATTGKVLIHFPFTEHATILSGSVELTDSTGAHATLNPGDSYLVTQGSDILWEVRGAYVQKSFANRVEAQDSPGPLRIYLAREDVDGGELVELGSPEALGGVVLEGEPRIAARFDLPDASAGVMETTAGVLSIDFTFAAHATVSVRRLRLTDESGCTHTLRPGDAYFVPPGATVEWDVPHGPVQQSFFHSQP